MWRAAKAALGQHSSTSAPLTFSAKGCGGGRPVCCGVFTASPSTYQMPVANSALPREVTTQKHLQTSANVFWGAKSAQVENCCIRQLMISHLGRSAGLKALPWHRMASLAIERRPQYPPRPIMWLSCSCRNRISLTSSGRVRKAQGGGSAPGASRQPHKGWAKGIPPKGWGAQSKAAAAHRRGPFVWFAQRHHMGERQPCWAASRHQIPLSQLCQLLHLM